MKFLLSIFILLLPATFVMAESDNESKEYNARYHIMHHILDGYSWDFFKIPGDDDYVAFHLPRILWNGDEGSLDFYRNTASAVENGGYVSLYDVNKKYLDGELDLIDGQLLVPGSAAEIQAAGERIVNAQNPDEKEQYRQELKNNISAYKPIDFSITLNVFYMFITAFIMLLIFVKIGKRYQKYPNAVPRGIQSWLEPVFVFIRDDIARGYLPEKHYKKYLPLLFTFFFFIWILNLLGLTPFAANVTGNISVTLTLSLITLIILIFSATKDYWKHIFWMPGVPVPLKLIMLVVEVIGIISKPFALTIRLFAVITAGHVVIVSLASLIMVMGDMGANPLGGFLISPVSLIFMLFINLLELFIGTLQAYVFTLLSAVFIGQALEEHEHEHEHKTEKAAA